MSMEQRIETLEDVYQRAVAALRLSNEAIERLRAGALLRDQAMLELGAAVERSAESVLRMQTSITRMQTSISRMQTSISRLEESSQDIDQVLERNRETLQALLAYLPITQAEIVRLDNRIDAIEGA